MVFLHRKAFVGLLAVHAFCFAPAAVEGRSAFMRPTVLSSPAAHSIQRRSAVLSPPRPSAAVHLWKTTHETTLMAEQAKEGGGGGEKKVDAAPPPPSRPPPRKPEISPDMKKR